ncbi:MAG: GNAT family N-acyltransferase, partial [Gammaproteobacteria bacterium]
VRAALDWLEVAGEVRGRGAGTMPRQGPVVVVANHPYGGLEGLVLLEWLLAQRLDVKVLANEWLAMLPGLRPCLVGVDVFAAEGKLSGAQRNARAVREALRWLGSGGVLLVFPAGEVGHLRPRPLPIGPVVADGPWRLGVSNLLLRSQATAIPVWVEGGNSALFQAAGLVHPTLRTVLLPRELLNKEGRTVVFHVGEPVPASRWSREADPQAITDLLRLRSALASQSGPLAPSDALQESAAPTGACLAVAMPTLPVAPGVPAATLAAEWAAVPAADRLLEAGRFEICRIHPARSPALMHELGRLREMTFREVGEGTGRSLDLDAFDAHYTQLVLRDNLAGELAGAYRLTGVDDALAARGRDGLYTSTLFRFREPATLLLRNAVELGRSFVVPAYQRQHLPLMLLWRAVASHVMTATGRHLLFGPASLSARIRPEASALILEWLRLHRPHALLMPLVTGRRVTGLRTWPRRLRAELLACTDLDTLDRLVGDLDPESGGLPPLLRQYLRLGARFVAANRDAAFADAIDVLVTVDLRAVPDRVLVRLVGREMTESWRLCERDGFMTRRRLMTGRFRPATKMS